MLEKIRNENNQTTIVPEYIEVLGSMLQNRSLHNNRYPEHNEEQNSYIFTAYPAQIRDL